MSKNILIVESDTALSATLSQALEARGFAVQETTDGKGSVEQIRRDRPELVVLAVDLSAGQNGYLICGKLKKDDDLKTIPIVIVGNPDGFAQHRKLKAHADDYVAKPVNTDELVERVGGLIGFPELPAGEVVDDGLALGGLDGLDGLGDEPVQGEELAIEGEPLESHGDELALLDNPFGDSDQPVTGSLEEPVEAPPELSSPEDDFSGLDSLDGAEDDNALDSLGMPEAAGILGVPGAGSKLAIARSFRVPGWGSEAVPPP
ncbi:MAG: response regulator, partial [Archangium sp.]